MSALNYFLESSLALAFLWITYWLLMRNETQFAMRRYFLLGSLAISAFTPLIHLSNSAAKQFLPSAEQAISTAWLPELTVGSINPSDISNTKGIDWMNWGMVGYLTVGLILLAVFATQLFRMSQLFSISKKYRWRRCWVTESEKSKPTFSFFHFIFIGQANLLSSDDKNEILLHENVHVKRLHSVDILMVHMAKIVWWYHPVVYFIQRELTSVHEFEADEVSVKNKDIAEYSGLLAKVALQEIGYSLGSHFTNSLIIKRINMMQTAKQNLKSWRAAMVAFLAIALVVVIGCQDQLTIGEKKIDESELPEDVANQLKRLRMISPKSDFFVLKFNSGEQMYEYQKSHPKAAFPSVVVGTNDYAIVEPNGIFETLPKNENEVFSVVDEMATPVFGLKSLYGNLSHTLQYPKNARRKGIQGKVYIEFVVQTDGTLTDIKVIRGIDDEVDTEALRAFYQLNDKWYPAINKGQIVKMRLTMPIVFKLDDKEDEADAGKTENSMTELVAVGKRVK